MTDEDLTEIVAAAVEEATKDLRDRVDQLEAENDDLRDRVDQLEAENDGLRDRVDELKSELFETQEQTSSERAQLSARIFEVEEALDAVDQTVGDGEGDLTTEDLTPMEQIARLPEHVAADQFDNADHRNTYRARQVVRDWTDYSKKTPKGRLIKNADLCQVLTALGEGGRTESTTGRRVMDRIETLSKGAFERVKRKGSHVLVLENPERLGDPGSMGAPDAVVT